MSCKIKVGDLVRILAATEMWTSEPARSPLKKSLVGTIVPITNIDSKRFPHDYHIYCVRAGVERFYFQAHELELMYES